MKHVGKHINSLSVLLCACTSTVQTKQHTRQLQCSVITSESIIIRGVKRACKLAHRIPTGTDGAQSYQDFFESCDEHTYTRNVI